MSKNNDDSQNHKLLAKRKFVLPKISNKAKTARIHEKYIHVLSFTDGEVWSVMKVLSHVLKLGERQTQKTLSDMCKSKLLKSESLDICTRLYGITPMGRAYLNNGSTNKTHQLGKMRIPLQTGHGFHGKVDSHSTAKWTLIPAQIGQS
jgi:hypothetical protein